MKVDAQDWPAISALFDQALDLPEARRRRWLNELPAHHQVHRQALEGLLADLASARAHDFLSELPRVGLAADPEPDSHGLGECIVGPYRLLRELGRGGMGAVWLAERADGVLKRQVALKLPHPGLATHAFAERLERERDILASLAHPHIARLYDAGVTSDGQPFIALAYVEGQTLIDHCRTGGLGTRERVMLFLQVLEAVQYAHTHLVIHRDLKPSNVLVDGQGQIHLLDFGIAKLLVDGRAESTQLTLDAGQALTPDYASPEQIAGDPITTASDVYSLGVLLYELLARVRPYHLERGSDGDLRRVLEKTDVARPSSAARATGHGPTSRSLRGDLDTIVMKALKLPPAQRYSTANAFREDLQRYLDGEPVAARPDSTGYRVGKFVSRHRIVASAVTMVVAVLCMGLAGTAWQARKATQEAERAKAVQDFLISLFDNADPAKTRGQPLTASALLEQGQRQLETRLTDQPELKLTLNGVLATLYDKLDDDAKALPFSLARRDLALRLHGPNSREYGDALFQLADIQGVQDRTLGYATYQEAKRVLAPFASERRGELLTIDWSSAYLLGAMGRFEEAIATLKSTVPAVESFYGTSSWEAVHCKVLLAYNLAQTDDFTQAEQLIDQAEPALAGLEREHGPDVATMRNNLARAELRMWKPERAEKQARLGLAQYTQLLGPEARQVLVLRRTLAEALLTRGEYAQSAREARMVAEQSVLLFGAEDPLTRVCESGAVESLIMVGDVAAAESMARRSVALEPGSTLPVLPPAGMLENRLGLALVVSGKVDEGASILVEAEARSHAQQRDHGDEHARTLLYLATARLAQERAGEAVRLAERAAVEFSKTARGAEVLVARAQLTQAAARLRGGDSVQAERLINEARVHMQKVFRPEHPVYLIFELFEARMLGARGQADRAATLEAETRSKLRDRFGASPPDPLILVL